MGRRLSLLGVGVALLLLLLLLARWRSGGPEDRVVPPPRGAGPKVPVVQPVARPSPSAPAPTGTPLGEAMSVVAAAEGGHVVRCPSPVGGVGRHPFLRMAQEDGQLLAVVAEASGEGLLFPAPPAPGSLPPGELGRAMLAVQTPLGWVRWEGEGCVLDAVPQRRLTGRVEGAPPGGTWLAGCGLVMAPTDEEGFFDEHVAGGQACVLEVEGRGGWPLPMDHDHTDLVLEWSPPEAANPREAVRERLALAEAELAALEAMADPLDDALDQPLDPAVRALIEGWRASDLALREAKRSMLLRAMKRYAEPVDDDALTPP